MPDRPQQKKAIPGLRQRFGTACQCCRHRKIRCDVSVVGTPCTRCNRDKLACEVQQRKNQRLKFHPVNFRLADFQSAKSKPITVNSTQELAVDLQSPDHQQSFIATVSPPTSVLSFAGHGSSVTISEQQRPPEALSLTEVTPSATDASVLGKEANEEDHTSAVTAAIVEDKIGYQSSPFYLGNIQLSV